MRLFATHGFLGQLAQQLLQIVAAMQFFDHVRFLQLTPESVAAQKHDIAGHEPAGFAQFYLRRLGGDAEAVLHQVSAGMSFGLLVGNFARLDQGFDHGMIAGAGKQFAVAQVIGSAVADVCPPHVVAENERTHHDGAGFGLDGHAVAEGEYLPVRRGDGFGQKARWIRPASPRVPEARVQRGNRGFGGQRPVRVSAHAVRDDGERAFVADEDLRAILIVGTIADEADLGSLEVHRQPHPRLIGQVG